MSGVVDPLRTGLVAGLGRPGRNVTGLSLMAPEVIGKQMQLLKELIPWSALRIRQGDRQRCCSMRLCSSILGARP